MDTYKIIRFYERREPKILRHGVTLQQAQDYVFNSESNSRTCKKAWNKLRTKKYGAWLSAYMEETNNPEPPHDYFQ